MVELLFLNDMTFENLPRKLFHLLFVISTLSVYKICLEHVGLRTTANSDFTWNLLIERDFTLFKNDPEFDFEAVLQNKEPKQFYRMSRYIS